MTEPSSLLTAYTHQACPNCAARLRVRYASIGNRLRCKDCKHEFVSRVTLPCPGCNRPLHLRPQYFGQGVSCSHCHHPFKVRVPVACPGCQATLAFSPRHIGTRVRCEKCQQNFPFGPPPGSTCGLHDYQVAAYLTDTYYASRDLQAELARATETEKALHSLQAELTRLRTEAAEDRRQRQEMETRWNDLASYAADLETRLDSERSRTDDQRGVWDSRAAAARLDKDRERQLLQEETERLRKQLEEARGEMGFMRKSLDALTAERDALASRVAGTESVTPSPESPVALETVQLNEALEAAHRRQEELTWREEELSAKLERQADELHTSNRRVAEATHRITDLEAALAEARQRAEVAEKALEEERQRGTGGATYVQDLENRLSAEQKRAETIQTGLEQRLEAFRQAHDQEVGALRGEIARLQAGAVRPGGGAPSVAQDSFWAMLGNPGTPSAPSVTQVSSTAQGPMPSFPAGPPSPVALPPLPTNGPTRPAPTVEEMLRWAADNGSPPAEKIREILNLLGPQPLPALLQAAQGDAAMKLGAARGCRWAAERFRKAGDLHQAELASAHAVDLFVRLVQEFPGVPALRAELGANHLNRARLQYQTGQIQDALLTFQGARQLAEALVAEHPGVATYRRALALCLHDQAVVLLQMGHTSDAQMILRHAIEHQAVVVQESPQMAQYRSELERMESLLQTTPVG